MRCSHFLEALERRTFLSVNASVTDGALNITDDNNGNNLSVRLVTPSDATTTPTVQGGATNVSLDPTVLAAAGLVANGVSSTVAPADPANFQFALPIMNSSDLRYQVDPFTPQAGVIRHSGTISFNNGGLVIGNFELGFDASRATNGRSGFFLRDTVGGAGIVFDISTTTSQTINQNELVLSGYLLISPEFGARLQSSGLATTDLTGTAVGITQVNASTDVATRSQFVVSSNDSEQRFTVADVNRINILLGTGGDNVLLQQVDRSTSVNLGNGNTSLSALGSQGPLVVNGGTGTDRIAAIGGRFSNLVINGSTGDDTVVLVNSTVSNTAIFAGGAGNNSLGLINTDIPQASVTGFAKQVAV